ncbi:ABC transporter substrate-binding protein [Treponema pedis]|uniref:Iron ABC transporter substrate-binding protein n=1 Tax=Treponema pedis str. T A4 TaxID=1291379 RepID=S5ZRV8_9SPIR|nr:ABC transporter substrate-binding protein [Treponema pedis]AGT42785.1 iron ABC transporter substrate-binding protein [Treponema pedis str. T A4]
MIKKNHFVAIFMFIIIGLQIFASGNGEKLKKKKFAEITDHFERKVIIYEKSNRIVAPFYILTNTALAIGCKDIIVSGDGGREVRPFVKEFAPELAYKPVCGSAKNLNIESIAALNPDLILVPFKAADQLPKLESLGVPALVIKPETMENFFSYVEMLGKATGKNNEADKLLKFYNEILSDVTSFIKGEEPVSVYMNSRSDALNELSPKMFQAELIRAAGGKLVAEDIKDTYWTKVSLEQVHKYAPQVIVMAAGAKKAEELRSKMEWKGIPAVDAGRIYVFPSSVDEWDSPIPSSCLGIIWLADKLHPGKIPDNYLETKVKAFYKEFFGKEKDLKSLGIK